ncbi:filamentous hemagglutinin N-terminal domain-containing protein [Acinetobacter modestus]|uniref:two-partner secretion domain-containing protein n=1 Tax=Acinetobacter modestus TaxID=1776740 RepID=UPI001F4AB68C|nr:filamentous hemagglutinin N-terminal domain-containing protein [Acinetobacter modestus]MCH7331909.1 filamentous hemagglutinin N-terminal domain-containing protein [Acinetobacter modestus]
MNKIYRLVWNSTHLCWQVVSEIAKGGIAAEQTATKKESKITLGFTTKLAAFFAVNVLSVSIAFAGPTGGVVSSGTASISTAGTTTTINQSTSKAAIDWSSFSTNSNEIVNFVQPNSSSITLNRVTGTSASTLNGQLNANGQVFIINPNGVLFGSTSQVNTAGLVASTLNLSNSDFNNNLFNFSNTSNNKVVENRGKITVPTGGTVALIAPTVKQTGTIKAPQGNVLLAAGGDITLNLNNGSLLGYTINQGKAQALINAGGMIQADGGKVVLTAKGIDELSNAVVNSVGIIQAQTVNNVRGVIELGSDLTSGKVNVGGTLDASAPNGGNGGQIKTSAAEVHINLGTNITTQRNTTTSLPPTTSGWELKAKNIDVDFYGGTVIGSTLGDALNKGNVTLSAIGTAEGQGNINVNDVTSWNANTALTLTANKDINFNSDLDLSGDKAKLTMNYGIGSDYNLNNGAKINISGSSPTLLINGTSYIVINNLGEEGDANINTLQGINNNLIGNYVLGSDIDASDTVNWNGGLGFTPIGEAHMTNDGTTVTGNIFQGQFHGLGHSIKNISINQPIAIDSIENQTLSGVGLFGAASNTLRDINLDGGSISGTIMVGALSGVQLGGIIKNVHSSAQVKGAASVGGLIGANGTIDQLDNKINGSVIFNSSSSGIVEGTFIVGGLVGSNVGDILGSSASGNIQAVNPTLGGQVFGGLVGANVGNITNSFASGNVGGVNVSSVGGLVGTSRSTRNQSTTIQNSYATGDVYALQNAGGLVAASYQSNTSNAAIANSYATGNVYSDRGDSAGLVGHNNATIYNSYSTGSVSSGGLGSSYVGGLVGSQGQYSQIINSYWNTETSGQLTSAGGVGKTTAELQQIMTFANWDIANVSDANSTSVWVIDENNTTPWLRYNH